MSDRPASIVTLDFKKADNIRLHKSGRIRHRGSARDARPVGPDGKLLTKKQIRARARRAAERARRGTKPLMSEIEFETLYKPVEEWDLDELANGRPRNINGNFSGRKPSWITREVHERAMEQFQMVIRTEMGTLTPSALDSLRWVIENEDKDDRGKPIVPAAAKNQASMFLIEHLIGKPKQHVQQDISVKLQGILGQVMVNPNEALAPPEQGGNGYQLAHFPGQTIPMGLPSGSSGAEDDDFDLEEVEG